MCNGLEPFEQLERGPTKDHSCEVWSKSNQCFRRSRLKKLFMDGRADARTHDGQNVITKAHHVTM